MVIEKNNFSLVLKYPMEVDLLWKFNSILSDCILSKIMLCLFTPGMDWNTFS